MSWRLIKLGDNSAIEFAVTELDKYIKLMDNTAMVDIIYSDEYDSSRKDCLWVGINDALNDYITAVKNNELDDSIYINVVEGKGIITGSNPRSVLIAAYRYLSELGCAFLRPGINGEVIPKKKAEDDSVYIKEAASYRHRSICIEGSISYEHVRNMIDWMPKVGMNGYFNQFKIPYTFFNKWYSHSVNPDMNPEPVTIQDVQGMSKSYVGELKKRGMDYHSVGHGWTCDPFGITATGWDVNNVKIPEGVENYFAMVNGKREPWGGVLLNTNLCYSNPEVQNLMTDAIIEYSIKNPEVDYLHFWLADGSNNHCECDNCVERPSDYYVMMLNQLDEKMSARKIKTKIVFLIYVDLLWEPEKQKLRNPDRFVLMFAPITRTYSKSFADNDQTSNIQLDTYVKNKLRMPRTVEENIARLKKWQDSAHTDSFDFDYHFMWDHFLDPGYYRMAKIISEDMKSLESIGLNGMLSCQNQRVFFPTSLGMLCMAKTLWNKEISFEKIRDDYLNMSFGKDWDKVREYLSNISELFDPEYLRGEKITSNPENIEKLGEIPARVCEFMTVIANNLLEDNNPAVSRSWQYLSYHAAYCIQLSLLLKSKAEGDIVEMRKGWDNIVRYLRSIERDIHNVFDLYIAE